MKLHKSIFVLVTVGFFVVSCQQGEDTVAELTETSEPAMVPSETPTLTPSPSFTIKPTPTRTPTASTTPTATLTSLCVDTYQTAPMTDKQLEHLRNHNYNFLFASEGESVTDVYSINRADTLCAAAYLALDGNGVSSQAFKIISGFIVDLNQPNKNLYDPGGINIGGGGFVNIYAKARFVGRDGTGHEYWLQLQGLPSGFWYQLVQWSGLITEHGDQPGLLVEQVFLAGKNSNGTSSYIDATTILPDGLIMVGDQFIAIIHVGAVNSITGYSPINQFIDQFVRAVEGTDDFPVAPYGFYFPVQSLLVPAKP